MQHFPELAWAKTTDIVLVIFSESILDRLEASFTAFNSDASPIDLSQNMNHFHGQILETAFFHTKQGTLLIREGLHGEKAHCYNDIAEY